MVVGSLIFNGYNTLIETFDKSREIIKRQNITQAAISVMYKASQERALTVLEMSRTTDDFALDDLRQLMRHQADVFISAREEVAALAVSPSDLQRYFPPSLRQVLTDNANLQNQAADLFVDKKYAKGNRIMLEYSTPEQMETLSGIALMNMRLDNDVDAVLNQLHDDVVEAKLDFKIVGAFTILLFTGFIIIIILRLSYGKRELSGQLHNQELQYKKIVDTVQDGIITMSNEGVISSFNRGAEKIFGYEASDVVGRSIKRLIYGSGFSSLEKHTAAVLDGTESLGLSITGKRFDGELISLLITFSTTGLSGEHELSGILKDVTVQKKSEEEQIKNSKLESIGVLAGGIAHDFNNLLSGINGYTDLAIHALDDKDKSSRYLESSKKAIKRATDLAQQLLTFSKGGEPIRRNAQVADMICESTDFVLHGSSVSCQYDIADNLWLVNVDNNQIGQVIQNIVINAKLAMPDGGMVNISGQNTTDVLVDEEIKASGRFVKISIEDTGLGMSEEVMASIFDPYFTTRETGSGLGLAVSYSIMAKHGGYIFVRSQVGEGSCFTLYLPAL